MKFLYGKQDLNSMSGLYGSTFLLTNGLGGYSSVTTSFSTPRSDQGILVAAVKAPNERINMVHRLRESLQFGGVETYLSSQEFADGTTAEEGYRYLTSFTYEYVPCWTYDVSGIHVTRRCGLLRGENTAAVVYHIENHSNDACTLYVEPFLKFAPKEEAIVSKKPFFFRKGRISSGSHTLYVHTNGNLEKTPVCWQLLAYPEDEKDGRPEKGLAASCCAVKCTVLPGKSEELEVVFSMNEQEYSGKQIVDSMHSRLEQIEQNSKFADPVARQLELAADAYIAHRDSTNGKTILAGYPLFSDWGRDTMIALSGCTLSTGRFEDAKSILRTFLTYEKDGLVPNLFPEGEAKPMYNTVDAALLLIDCIWQYLARTGDLDFIKEAWPVLKRIVSAYQKGTHHSIGMDEDGLIYAGGGLDQVTWMDVCVQGILPTPRHGKPVEINAYWYNALCIMTELSEKLGESGSEFHCLAEKVKASFVEKFYMEERGYLRDVISGTNADEQLRCNQIWAVSMPFTMLTQQQEKTIVDTVCRHLYTPCGLRTLSPEDPEYHASYGGDQVKRDMAYHQGTTWVFPLGGYYLAYLKVHGYSKEAARFVRGQLDALIPMLREGCAGQLPEIYDGDFPSEGKGCFAQAWSVGELLRVFEVIENIEKK